MDKKELEEIYSYYKVEIQKLTVARMELLFALLLKEYQQIKEYNQLLMIHVQDIKAYCTLSQNNNKGRFIDSNELGAFKIEKYIRRGVSLGAKQYAYEGYDAKDK